MRMVVKPDDLQTITTEETPENDQVCLGVQVLVDGENLYMATVEHLKAQKRPSDMAAATEFILAKLGELLDHLEDSYGLRIEVAYYYMTRVGEDALRSRRILWRFKGQLKLLGIETLVVEKWNEKAGNVDPRLISEAYRSLFVDRKAPSNLVLVSGDKDYEPMLVDYQRQGRK